MKAMFLSEESPSILPKLMVVIRTVGLVVLEHEGDVLVRGVSFHLAEAHGPNMDAACALNARHFRVHKCRVPALSLWARDGAMSSTMVMQKLIWEVPAAAGDPRATRHVAVHQERAVLRHGPELSKHVL